MQDRDTPPAVVVEGETGGAVGVVHQVVAVMDVIVSNRAESIPPPWITATAHTLAEDKGAAAVAARASAHLFHSRNRNLCRNATAPTPESSLS